MKNGLWRLAPGPVLLLLLVGCSPAMEWTAVRTMVSTAFPAVEQVSTDSLASMLAAGQSIHLLDVRTEDEFRVSHLPGATHIDPDETQFGALPKGATIVAYCSVGYRSSALADRLQDAGFKVINLEGSIFQWANEGRPLEDANGPATKVHAFDKTWGKLLNKELRTGL
ncbi:MAG: rhodanese-related sulfurtransferase [Rhodothermales bacterium]|jgi:rhodanese-related sulfurtransferase